MRVPKRKNKRKIKERKQDETLNVIQQKIGRPPGSKSQNIPINKQEEMFCVWSDHQNLKHVSAVCGISVGTVRKYKESNNWEERLAVILERLQGNVNEHVLEVKKDMVLQLTALRYQAKSQALTGEYKDAGQASNAFINLLKEELGLRGQLQVEGLDLLALAAERFKERLDRKEAPKELLPGEYVISDTDQGKDSTSDEQERGKRGQKGRGPGHQVP